MTIDSPTPALVDTHAHLNSSRLVGDLEDLLRRARESGLVRIVSIACDLEDSKANFELAARETLVAPTAGVHPLYVHEVAGNDWDRELRSFAERPTCTAVGEIGLDYFHPPQDGSSDEAWRTRQKDAFVKQLQIALDLGLPAVIHQRASFDDTMEVLADFPDVRCVLHCFTGSVAEAERALDAGHWLSFTGILTFPNAAEVRESAKIVPLDRVMVETDAPFLAPVPFRGKRCEPTHVVHTARALADLHDVSQDEIARTTTRNANAFFRGLDCPVPG